MNWDAVIKNPWAQTVGGGLLVLFGGWLVRRFFNRKQEAPPSFIHQNASPVITQTFNPTINIHPPATHLAAPTEHLPGTKTPRSLGSSEQNAAPTSAPQAAPAINPLSRGPNLVWTGSNETRVYISPDPRRGVCELLSSDGDEESFPALIFKFENRPIAGERIDRAMNVIAKLTFKSANGVTEQVVDYGVWLDSSCESTSMDPGDTRRLLVMCAGDEDRLVGFEDLRASSRRFVKQGPRRVIEFMEYVKPLRVTELELLAVTVIEKNSQASATYGFRVSRSQGHFSISPR